MSRKPARKPSQSASGPPLSPLPPPSKAPQGVWRFALPLLLVIYVVLGCWHAGMVPTGETGYQNAPDEAAHVAYVWAIAQGRLPRQEDAKSDPLQRSYEWHQPPLYYGLVSPFLRGGVHALRYVSLLFGIGAILLIYRAGRLLFPDDPALALLASGIAALTPTHIAITSTVNNDGLLEVCFSGALLALLTSFHGGFTLWRAGWLGVAIGAALLTKATGLLLLPIAIFGLFLLWKGGERPRDVLRGAGWMLLLAVAISGWWFVRNGRLYGEWLPMRAFQASFAATVQRTDVMKGIIVGPVDTWLDYLLLVGQWTFQSFWAVYGTPQAALAGAPRFLPAQIYGLLGLVSAMGLAGTIRLHFRRKMDLIEMQQNGIYLLLATLAAVMLSFVAFILRYFQTQGRYLYPAMLPICLLLALGWRAVFPERYRDLASGLLLGLLLAVAIALLLKISPT